MAWVPAIQDQGTAEDCWTFASSTAMDSNLLKSGLLPTSSVAPGIQISSWHLSTHNGAPDQLIATEAFNNNSNWGGDEFQALGYVTRGSGSWQIPNAPGGVHSGNYIQTMSGGPVLESTNPLNVFPASIIAWQPLSPEHPDGYPPNLAPLIPPPNQPTAFKVTAMAFYDQGFSNNVPLPASTGDVTLGGSTYSAYSFTLGASDPQVEVVKQAILQNGAVTTYMNADGNFHQAPGNVIQYFNGNSATGYSDHSVTIIGWNDTYSMTDPHTLATSTGAWLVQNSWGTGGTSGDGTFWASYNDAVIGRSGVSSFQLASMAPYSQTVLQNELGPMDYSGDYLTSNQTIPTSLTNAPTGMACDPHSVGASILTPAADGTLLALGVVTQVAGVKVKVDIFDSWNNGPSSLLANQTFTLDSIGYQQLDLSQALSVYAQDSFVVQLTYLDANTLQAVSNALPVTFGGSGLNGYDTVPGGLSYYLDGSNWVDFSTVQYQSVFSGVPDTLNGGILFLKGITAVPEPGTIFLALLGVFVILAGSRRLKVRG